MWLRCWRGLELRLSKYLRFLRLVSNWLVDVWIDWLMFLWYDMIWLIDWLIDVFMISVLMYWLIDWLMYLWLMYWLVDKLRKPYFFRISLRGSKERKVKPKKKLKKNIKIRLKPRMWVGVEPPTQLWFYFNQAVIPLLDHRDKDVREEGKKLIIESYRWIGNTYHLLIILSCRVSHILLDRAQFKKLGFSELLENFKTLNHSKKTVQVACRK